MDANAIQAARETALQIIEEIMPEPQDGERIESDRDTPFGLSQAGLDDPQGLLDAIVSPWGEEGWLNRIYHNSRFQLVDWTFPHRLDEDANFGVALRGTNTGRHGEVTHCGSLWSVIPHGHFSGYDNPAEAVMEAIDRFALRPPIVTRVPGYSIVYWPLVGAVDLRDPDLAESVYKLNWALARGICGRYRQPTVPQPLKCFLPLPGSLRHWVEWEPPVPVEVVRSERGKHTSLGEALQVVTDTCPWALEPLSYEDRWLIDANRWGLPPDKLALIDSEGAAGFATAEEADLALAIALVRAIPGDYLAASVEQMIVMGKRGDDIRRRLGEDLDREVDYLNDVYRRAYAICEADGTLPDE